VAAALDEHRPDALVNCAAWTNVDSAESHRDEVFAVNETAVRALAEECARRRIRLMHISTDYIFDGSSPTPIPETATPSPLSVYGASKIAGEHAVRAVSESHVIVRTSGLYGRDGPNFLLKVLRRAAAGAEVRVVTDQVTAPTWTGHLAPALLRLLELGATGTYHLTNSGTTSWYEFAVAAVKYAGYPTAVCPIPTSELAAVARRPPYAVLDNCAWRSLGEPPLPSLTVALHEYVAQLRGRGMMPLPSNAA
jgi:dTDP-4-dehydrorhamnose reductase